MEKVMRSLCRSVFRRPQSISTTTTGESVALNRDVRHLHFSSPSFFSSFPNHFQSGSRSPFAISSGSMRFFSDDVARLLTDPEIKRSFEDLVAKSGEFPSDLVNDVKQALSKNIDYKAGLETSGNVLHAPQIKDHEIESAFKDLMATNWDELPAAVVHDVKRALGKNTDDKAGQEALANVFRAAEAVEEFTGILMSLKMELDDSIGASGEDVKPAPEYIVNAVQTVFERYAAYLGAFGPEETYLRKKVETELGTKMIYLKMRCGGLASDWGKVTVLGTSGISGSYIEQRA